MSIGSYKKKIQFITYTSVDDAYGGTVDTPVVVLETFAEIKPLRGSRALSLAQLGLYSAQQFNVRWREGFIPDEKMKIKIVGENILYSIHEALDVRGAQRFWDISATAKQAAV